MTRPSLGETGQIYVTWSAAEEYAERQDLDHEEARRELTGLLLDARPGHDEHDETERWRYRRRSSGVDITARVVREGRLAMVVAISVRGYSSRAENARRRRRQ